MIWALARLFLPCALVAACASADVFVPMPEPDTPREFDPRMDDVTNEGLKQLYRDTLLEMRLIPRRLSPETPLYIDGEAYGCRRDHFHPPLCISRYGGTLTPGMDVTTLEAISAFALEPLPRQQIDLLLRAYETALSAETVDWNTIRMCLAIARTKKQTQLLPELLPLLVRTLNVPRTKQSLGLDRSRAYYEALVAIGLQRSDEAMAVLNRMIAPDYWGAAFYCHADSRVAGHPAKPDSKELDSAQQMRFCAAYTMNRFFDWDKTRPLFEHWERVVENRLKPGAEVLSSFSAGQLYWEKRILDQLRAITAERATSGAGANEKTSQ